MPAVDTGAIKGRRTFCDVNKNREITAEWFFERLPTPRLAHNLTDSLVILTGRQSAAQPTVFLQTWETGGKLQGGSWGGLGPHVASTYRLQKKVDEW